MLEEDANCLTAHNIGRKGAEVRFQSGEAPRVEKSKKLEAGCAFK